MHENTVTNDEVHKAIRAEIRTHNHRVIEEAGLKLYPQQLTLGEELIEPLNNLRFNILPFDYQGKDVKFYLGLRKDINTLNGSKNKTTLCLRIFSKISSKEETIAEITTAQSAPNLLMTAFRLRDYVIADEVLSISYDVQVFDPLYEGNGFGRTLSNQVKFLTNIGISGLENKKVIFLYALDVAHGTSHQREQINAQYRQGWTTSVATSSENALTTNLQVLEKYFQLSIIAASGKNTLSIKVLQDLTVTPPIYLQPAFVPR